MKKVDQENRVDKLWRTIKNNKLIACLIIFGTIIIAVAKFTTALQVIIESIDRNRSSDYQEMKNIFGKINNDYIENFLHYLVIFDDGADPRKIAKQLTDLNLATAGDRNNLIRIAKKKGNLQDNKIYNLLMDYFGVSDTEYVYNDFDKELIVHQRWRKSIINDIEWILSDRWQLYFDPGGMAPPMSEIELAKKIEEKWESIKDSKDEVFNEKKFKRYLIRDSIQSNLAKCQKLAIEINKSFDEL
jgi:hypothetical protein